MKPGGASPGRRNSTEGNHRKIFYHLWTFLVTLLFDIRRSFLQFSYIVTPRTLKIKREKRTVEQQNEQILLSYNCSTSYCCVNFLTHLLRMSQVCSSDLLNCARNEIRNINCLPFYSSSIQESIF